MSNVVQRIDEAVMLTRNGEYLAALTEFIDIYGGEDPPSIMITAKLATGLSFFGL